jgi:hypothetical protein
LCGASEETIVKSSPLATILAILSLAGVGVVYLKVENLSDEIRPLTHGRAQRSREVLARETYERPDPARGGPTGEDGSVPADASDDEPAPTLEQRLSRLERRVEKQAGETGIRFPGNRAFKVPRFARSVDDLAATLELRPAQKDRIRAAVERGKRRIEEILKIPDEEGRSPFDRRQEQRKRMEEAVKSGETGGLITMAFDGFSYRNKQIPGRNATYGEEIRRVQQETRKEIEACLDPDQRATFEDTRIEPMLGGGGAAMSFATFVEDDGEGSTAREIQIGIAESVEIEAEGE